MANYVRRALSSKSGRTFATVASAVAWIPALLFLSENTYEIGHLRGRSMNPSFNTPPPNASHETSASGTAPTGTTNSNSVYRDSILISRIRPASNLRRGDIIAFWTPHDPNNIAVKRVVALENDEVQTRPPYPFRHEIVPPGTVWVEGDNPEGRFSRDSNDYGPISKSLITGKVLARIWPDPKLVRPEEWEASDQRLKDGRIRRNVGNAEKAVIY